MRSCLLLTAVGLLSAFPVNAQDAAAKAEAVKKDAESLQGTWIAVAAERDGEKADAERLKSIKLVFKDNMVSHRQTGRYELHPDKAPKAIDIKPMEDSDPDKVIQGIYAIKGEELTLCVAMPGKERPTEFGAPKDKQWALIVLKKSK
jgi:uncharacterized protein (TIGR03067 family)